MANGIRNTTKIKEGKNRLLDIRAKVPDWQPNKSYWFSEGDVRKMLEGMFKEGAHYSFMRTIANPEAIDLIDSRSEELSRARYGPHCDSRVRFSADLMDAYIETLTKLAKKKRIKHVCYPIVENDGVHCLEQHPDQPSWPLIHVVRNGNDALKRFIKLTKQLNEDEAYNLVRKRESPQNYRMGEVKLLRSERVDPITLEDRVWNVDSETLRNAVDFIVQFTYSHRFNDHRYVDD
jgi:hypothetical protein